MEHTPVPTTRPPSACESGIADSVTRANWIDPPFNRHGFLHVRELTNTMTVPCGVPVELREGSALPVPAADAFRAALHATYTDACVVLQHGQVVFEYYDIGVDRQDRHLLMSVSKSLAATLVGALFDDGVLRPEQEVTDFFPELTEWSGCTLQHLLDMRAGIRFDEFDMDDMDCPGVLLEQVSGYTTHRRSDIPHDTRSWIRSLPATTPHGVRYEYRSILTDVLGWIVELVTGERFADVFSRLVWSRIGAEHPADLIVDSTGFPVVEGGFCATARDVARFGQMHLQRGVVGDDRIVSSEWVDRVVHRDQRLIDDFARGHDSDPTNPEAFYHDGWWVLDARLGRYTGLGLNGQHLLVDRSTDSVVVKLSTWPKRIDPLLAAHERAALTDLLTALLTAAP